MAGLNIIAVREAIADQLKAAQIEGLSVYAYDPGDPPSYPAAIVQHAGAGDYATTFGAQGVAEVTMRVQLRANAAESESAERTLDALLSAGTGASRSVFDVLDADRTFGGTVSTFTISDVAWPTQTNDQAGNPIWIASISFSIKQPRS